MKQNRNRITQVSIKGYRSLKEVKDLALTDLNVLIGPNGVGKSNFIDFFQMLNYAMAESLQLFAQTRGFGNSMLFHGFEYQTGPPCLISRETGRRSGALKAVQACGRRVFRPGLAGIAG